MVQRLFDDGRCELLVCWKCCSAAQFVYPLLSEYVHAGITSEKRKLVPESGVF